MVLCAPAVPIGSDVDPHCRIHDRFRRHVRQDLEGACHLQECEDEEEGNGNVLMQTKCLKGYFYIYGCLYSLYIYRERFFIHE